MYSENVLESQVSLVGMDFIAGVEANAEIDRLLGFDAEKDGRPSPDYRSNSKEVVVALEKIGIAVFVLPVSASKKKGATEEHIAVFEMDGTLYSTVPQETEEIAAACALWFAASNKSVMT